MVCGGGGEGWVGDPPHLVCETYLYALLDSKRRLAADRHVVCIKPAWLLLLSCAFRALGVHVIPLGWVLGR